MGYLAAVGDSEGCRDNNPPRAAQVGFWNEWNTSHLASTTQRDSFQIQQREAASAVVARAAQRTQDRPLRILDFGCGTGWLGAELAVYGEVTGIDLSPAAIQHGQQEYPALHLMAGDFDDPRLVGPFDVIISSDVIAHVADQQRYIARAAELLRPGGIFFLMTQNSFVWHRTSDLRPQGQGQIRNWPTLAFLQKVLAANEFMVLRVRSIQPAGDRGILRVLNNRWLRGGFLLLGLRRAWKATLERLLLGRDFTIEARRL